MISSITRFDGGRDAESGPARSGDLVRPIHCISRAAVAPGSAVTELERYKLSLRRFTPGDGASWLPWPCQAQCAGCGRTVAATFQQASNGGGVALEVRCPDCGTRCEPHRDAICTTDSPFDGDGADRPRRTLSGSPIRPVIPELPRTVETLCPHCRCILLGRYYVRDGAVWIEKTCPEHGYFRDKINSDVKLHLKAARAVFQDERGVRRPQVHGGGHCPTDCGLCNQHVSGSCLAQIDLSTRCNLTCPVCFAGANTNGQVAEPTFQMVVEMLTALRRQEPYPATAIQFTGGEPTIHPEFHRIIARTREMGFTHIQIATNGITHASLEFAQRSAEAGLHTLYLQFDGLDDALYVKARGRPLLDLKLACIENCRRTGLKVVLVPTIIKGFNDHQVGEIFRFAVEHIDAVSAISYQPVAFTGRINQRDLERCRYTLGDLARDVASASGADLERDFWPLGMLTPLARIMECIDGRSKIRPSCHSDCAFGTYFFVTPERRAVPIPQLFDMYRIMADFNDQARRVQRRRRSDAEIVRADPRELARIAWTFIRRYNWRHFFRTDITPWTFIRALQGLTDKSKGRGAAERKSYKTLMAAGMHFMDRYNYDTDRVRRCVIQYSTPDGIYPFCTINGGPEYRPFIERVIAQSADRWQQDHPHLAVRPDPHPEAVKPGEGRIGQEAPTFS